jgi:catechol 2,3-dioxygenase-like lactoylglutathione lyase family enzyme
MKFIPGEINIICTNLENSLIFYRDVLGFTVVDHADPAIRLACGERHYLLLAVAQLRADVRPYCCKATFSIDLLVDDLDEAVEHFRQHEVKFVDEFPRNDKRCFIEDPDGLVIEIIKADN